MSPYEGAGLSVKQPARCPGAFALVALHFIRFLLTFVAGLEEQNSRIKQISRVLATRARAPRRRSTCCQ